MSNFSISINYGFFLEDDKRFELVKNAGFSAVGLWYGKESEHFKIPLDRQFELVKEYGLEVDYLHAPFYFHTQLRDSDEAIRNESIAEHKRWIDICKRENIDKLVLHLNRLTKDEYITDILIDSLTQINDYAIKNGVKIAVENIGRPDDLERVFDEIDNIYFCIDSSHASLEGDTEGRILSKYADRLICTHFSDNDGIADRHWILGKGIINFNNMAKILKENNYTGRINCEVVADSSYTNPSEFLADLYNKMNYYFGDFNIER